MEVGDEPEPPFRATLYPPNRSVPIVARLEDAHLRDERVLPASTLWRFSYRHDQHSISLAALVAEQGKCSRERSLSMSEPINPQFDPSQYTMEAIAARLEESRRERRLKRRPANALHVRPNLDYYREQAQRLHKSQREHDSSAKVHLAQLQIANSLGFPSWPNLAAAIRDRERAANELCDALRRGQHEAITRVVRAHPHALLDAGCVASPTELGLLLEIVPVSNNDAKRRNALLDAVAEHHDPDGLEECIRLLTDWSDVDPDYADDTIKARWLRAEASPNGARDAELLENALGVLSWLTDPPDYSEYLSESD